MKILITGASGAIGRRVVAYLRPRHELRLAGRNIQDLRDRFPGLDYSPIEDLPAAVAGCDTILHLAARNNDRGGTINDFIDDNLKLTQDIAEAALDAGVERFVFASTTRALDPSLQDHYGLSKKRAEDLLLGISGIDIRILRFAAVSTGQMRGKTGFLSILPGDIQNLALRALATLRPTTSLSNVLNTIDRALLGNGDPVQLITDRQIGNRAYHGTKRLIDLTGALVLLSLTWWMLILTTFGIWLLDGRPVIFRQTRLGQDQQPFELYKFRSMKLETPEAGTHELSADALTRTGRLLRRTKLDELPQIFNILKGELSLVGPRPGLPVQTDLTRERHAKDVFVAMPGLTGLAQIEGIDMRDPVRLAEKDALYVSLRSALLDLRILMKTLLLPFRRN